METRPALSEAYTLGDHAFRSDDPYAAAKYRMTLQWLRNDLHDGTVLYNIGAGGGHFNGLAAAAGKLQIVACEPDPLAFAQANASAPPGVEVLHCGLEDFANGRSAADVVVMHDVLEHIEDDHGAAELVRSLLRPGGTAIVSVPALMSLYGVHDEALGHFRRYTPVSLRRVLEPHFVVERLQWYGMASIPIAWYFSKMRRIAYPVAATRSALGAIYAKMCHLESFVPEPIGTSLVARLRAR
jgi:SAM-dependent methyltransferase